VRALGLADGRSRSVSPAICLRTTPVRCPSYGFRRASCKTLPEIWSTAEWDTRGRCVWPVSALNVFLADRDGLVTCTISVPSDSLFA
jgi:hypothetical protein